MHRTTLIASIVWCLLALPACADTSAATFARSLPHDWIAVVAVAEPVESLEQLRPALAVAKIKPPKQFETYLPLLAGLDGIDQSGQLIVGLAQLDDGRLQPFVLLPTTDADALIESFDGDPSLEQPEFDFGGEKVVAIRRGAWLALCGDEVAGLFTDTDTDAEPQSIPALGETFTLAIRPAAWRQALAIGNKIKQEDRRWYSRVRRLSAGGNWIPHNRVALMDWLLAAMPVIELLDDSQVAVTLACHISSDQVVAELLLSSIKYDDKMDDKGIPTTTTELLTRSATISSMTGSLPAVWRGKLVEGLLRWQMSTSEEPMLFMGRSRYYDRFIEACAAIAGQAHGIEAAALVPEAELPPMTNQAIVISCPDSEGLVESIEHAFDIWNQMATVEMRQSKLIFEKSDVEFGEITALRYSVDLQTAFQANDVPEVRTIMIKLFGLPGELVYYVVPLDESHVLVSQWREEQTKDYFDAWKLFTGQNEGPPNPSLRITFSPQEYRRWLAQRYEIEYAESDHGPKAIPIANDGIVEAIVKANGNQLSLKVSTTRELLAEWFQSQASKE